MFKATKELSLHARAVSRRDIVRLLLIYLMASPASLMRISLAAIAAQISGEAFQVGRVSSSRSPAKPSAFPSE